MQHISNAIEKLLRKTGLEKGVMQQNALLLWADIVGDSVAENTEAERIDHGVLMVKTSTPVWRQELQFQKKDIVKKLNKKLGKNIIKDIRFV
tara:strand:- start:532 stop:807 length:276 start_codon:yes stop_codon:yes gene_type:complete